MFCNQPEQFDKSTDKRLIINMVTISLYVISAAIFLPEQHVATFQLAYLTCNVLRNVGNSQHLSGSEIIHECGKTELYTQQLSIFHICSQA